MQHISTSRCRLVSTSSETSFDMSRLLRFEQLEKKCMAAGPWPHDDKRSTGPNSATSKECRLTWYTRLYSSQGHYVQKVQLSRRLYQGLRPLSLQNGDQPVRTTLPCLSGAPERRYGERWEALTGIPLQSMSLLLDRGKEIAVSPSSSSPSSTRLRHNERRDNSRLDTSSTRW